MKIFTHVKALQNYLDIKRSKGKIIAFAPTMGALHDGHMQLINNAMDVCDVVVASIFVNPTQFNNAEDLDTYPRQVEVDADMLRSNGCHVLFHPSVEEVYPSDFQVPTVDLGSLAEVMEGANRPGHFEGVVEVVSRLFDIVQPDKALFGEKDFQQLAILRRMTEELDYNIEIIGVPIVRENSGLAMSSRNQRLSVEAREKATFIHKTLLWVIEIAKKHSPEEIKALVKERFADNSDLELEYFEIADNRTLKSCVNWSGLSGCRAFVVAWIDGVRLIDNMECGLNAAML